MREFEVGFPYPFEYKAENGFEAICEVRSYQYLGKTIVVATDSDTGPSVTNNVERIATLLREGGIAWDAFCEHYQAQPEIARDETFDWVSFEWDKDAATHPAWRPGSRTELEAFIGQSFK